ncbi:hypothetical protein RHGRI_025454 [Rhododendron griersonianum]|uniref:Chitin-binding type-1 domain-containing protein n=1 Tax=Rhododendron griersonianum TaxID=479676 RepID=A0AAV6ITN4_9ERIC|nr:hypothetical protein RHGRI_025454 [Rhododendron griersonianum]
MPLARILAGAALPTLISGQSCGCNADECCSQYSYCGTSDAYCGTGCQAGPCTTASGTTPIDVSVSDIVTDAFFNVIIDQAVVSCAGKGFYTWSVFLQVADSYPLFGREGSIDDSKREIAAAFVHFTHQTEPGKSYYGRGPIQLSWNFNYEPAGNSIGFDGLNNPDLIATDPLIAFKTALWYWMNLVHSIIVSGQGFGETIRAINSLECNGGNPATVNARVEYYTEDAYDVRKMCSCFVERYDFSVEYITVLIGNDHSYTQPTGRNIRLALSDLLRSIGPDDFLFVHYGGHGTYP